MFLIWSIIQVVFSTDCSNLASDYTKIVGKQNEVITKSIGQFFQTSTDQYQLEDVNKKLSLVDKIHLIEKNDVLDQYELKSMVFFNVAESKMRTWVNKFAILGVKQDDSLTVIYTENTRQGADMRMPNFNKQLNLEANTMHYGLTVVYQDIVLDSSELQQENIQNYFYLIKKDEQIKIQNELPFADVNQNRQLISYLNYIFRGVPSQQSLIQIYLKNENEIKLIDTIDTQLIIPLIVNKTNWTDYVFQMIEFKVINEKNIVILDKMGNLLQLEQTDKWELKFLIKEAGECFSFDYNYIFENLVVIQKDKILTRHEKFEFSFDLSPYKIHITDDYYILTSDTEIIQLDQNLNQISKLSGNFAGALFDQITNDMVVITKDFKVQHFQLSDKVLLKYWNSELTSGTATLTSGGCQITIDYQNIENDSSELIQVNKNSIINGPLITQVYDLMNQLSVANHLFDGPNQQLDVESNSSNIVSITYIKDMLVGLNSTFKLDFIYFQICQIQLSLESFYMVTQLKNMSLQVQQCFSTSICFQQHALIPLEFELNELNTQLKTFSSSYFEVFIQNQNTITSIKYFHNGTNSYDINILVGLKIDSIHILQQYLLILCVEQKSIEVYQAVTMKYLSSINTETLLPLGIQEWNPTRLFTSLDEDYIYVQNGNTIVIIYIISKQFIIVDTLSIPELKDIKVINWEKRFGILQQLDNIELRIYNKQDLTSIYFEKTIPFYDYEIENLNSFISMENTGILSVIAKKGADNILLNYYIDDSAHNSFYSQVKISPRNKYIRGLDFFIYFYNEDSTQTYVLYNVQQLASKIQMNDTTFAANASAKLVYSNGRKNFTLESQLRLINIQTHIVTDPSQISINTKLNSRKQSNHVIDLGNKWYSGQVSSFSVTSEQQRKIQIQQPIEQVQSQFSSNTIAIQELDSNNLFILKNTTYEIKKTTGEISLNGTFPNNMQCFSILSKTNNGKLMLHCYLEDNTKLGVLGFQYDKECKFSETTLQQNPSSVQIENELFFFIYYHGVEVYCGDILKLGESKLCGEQLFTNLLESTIAVQQIYQNHYHIYNINDEGELIITEYNYNAGVFEKNNQITFNLKKQINQLYYLSPLSVFVGIQVINKVQKEKQFSADYLFFSSNGPHYGVNLQFKCSEIDVCVIDSFEVKYIFQGYGTFDSQRSIHINQDLIIIPYHLGDNVQQVISIYEIPKEIKRNQAISMIGAVYPHYQQKQCSYEIYSVKNETFLLINEATPTSFDKCKITTSPKLVFDGSDIDSETIKITASNDFTTSTISLSIETPYSEKVIWPWILVGVLGGCVLIGSAMYIYYKKKAKVEETLI